MLVLSRKIGEKIYINDSIAVTVVRLDGNRVSLGFEAPDHVRIMRSELQPFAAPLPELEDVREITEFAGAAI